MQKAVKDVEQAKVIKRKKDGGTFNQLDSDGSVEEVSDDDSAGYAEEDIAKPSVEQQEDEETDFEDEQEPYVHDDFNEEAEEGKQKEAVAPSEVACMPNFEKESEMAKKRHEVVDSKAEAKKVAELKVQRSSSYMLTRNVKWTGKGKAPARKSTKVQA